MPFQFGDANKYPLGPPVWRMNAMQRHQTIKVCHRVWEALQDLREDHPDSERLTEAIEEIAAKLKSVLPFGPPEEVTGG